MGINSTGRVQGFGTPAQSQGRTPSATVSETVLEPLANVLTPSDLAMISAATGAQFQSTPQGLQMVQWYSPGVPINGDDYMNALSVVKDDLKEHGDLASTTAQFEGMIGKSAAMWETFARIRRVAPHFRTVLVTGQTGTGKELSARALHQLSPVSKGRFVVLNCSAVVETLFESELFGHVRGSFTGAAQDKMGLFEFADKGTIFLDEIGDMPLGTQAKLLRTLQNQEVLRVGSLTPRKVDARVIAATHRDLREAVAAKTFREDLFYRLSMVEIHVPSLEERKEDIPLLTNYFIEKFATQFRKQIRGITQRAQIILARHNWPGNIRELENVIGHAGMMVLGDMIDVVDLPDYLRFPTRHQSSGPVPVAEEGSDSFEEHEKRLVRDALARAEGNQSKAARELRIGRDALRYKMKKHGLL